MEDFFDMRKEGGEFEKLFEGLEIMKEDVKGCGASQYCVIRFNFAKTEISSSDTEKEMKEKFNSCIDTHLKKYLEDCLLDLTEKLKEWNKSGMALLDLIVKYLCNYQNWKNQAKKLEEEAKKCQEEEEATEMMEKAKRMRDFKNPKVKKRANSSHLSKS